MCNSRDCAEFVRQMKECAGDGGGVDVVLNSFSHEDYISASLDLLNENGRFMEIGKLGIWSTEAVRSRRPDVRYEVIALDDLTRSDPGWYGDLQDRLAERVANNGVKPLPVRCFDLEGECVDAFRFLQQAKHITKQMALPRHGCGA